MADRRMVPDSIPVLAYPGAFPNDEAKLLGHAVEVAAVTKAGAERTFTVTLTEDEILSFLDRGRLRALYLSAFLDQVRDPNE